MKVVQSLFSKKTLLVIEVEVGECRLLESEGTAAKGSSYKDLLSTPDVAISIVKPLMISEA